MDFRMIAITLVLYFKFVWNKGHLGYLADMHTASELPGPSSLHSENIATKGKTKHHGADKSEFKSGLADGNHRSRGSKAPADSSAKYKGVFGPTGKIIKELGSKTLEAGRKIAASAGNVAAQAALDEMANEKASSAAYDTLFGDNKPEAEVQKLEAELKLNKFIGSEDDASRDNLLQRRGAEAALEGAAGGDISAGKALKRMAKGAGYSAQKAPMNYELASAIEAQEAEGVRLAPVTQAKGDLAYETANDEEKSIRASAAAELATEKALAEGATSMEAANKAQKAANAQRAGDDAAYAAFNNGTSVDRAAIEGSIYAAAVMKGQDAADQALALGATVEEAAAAGEAAAKEEKEIQSELQKSKEQRAGATSEYKSPGVAAALAALRNGATSEQAERIGIVAQQSVHPGSLQPPGAKVASMIVALGGNSAQAAAIGSATQTAVDASAGMNPAQRAANAVLAAGASLEEASQATSAAQKEADNEKERQETAEAAEAQALSDGATPEEARSAAEEASKQVESYQAGSKQTSIIDTLKKEEEKAIKAAEAAEAEAIAQEAVVQNVGKQAGVVAAKEAIKSGATEAETKAIADKASREAAADTVKFTVANKAAEYGASPGEAIAVGEIAAKQAESKGVGAQFTDDIKNAETLLEDKAREIAASEIAEKREHEAHQEQISAMKEGKEHTGKMIEETSGAVGKSLYSEETQAGGRTGISASESKVKDRAVTTQESFKIIGTIPDEAESVNISRGFMKLPLKTFSSEKPRNEGEVEAKKEQDLLADQLRNKITKEYISSPLNVISGEDGYLNIAESATKLMVTEGTVYYPDSAKQEMKKAGIDTSMLKHRYNLGERPDRPSGEGYYVSDASGKEFDLPSPTLKNPSKILSGKSGVLDFSYSNGMDIATGKLMMTPWKEYSKRMRPELNIERYSVQKLEKADNDAEKEMEALSLTKREIITNPSGKQYVKLTPPFGVSEQMAVSDLVKGLSSKPSVSKESGQEGISILQQTQESEPVRSLNIAEKGGPRPGAIETAFEARILKSVGMSPEISDIASPSNSFNPSTNKVKETELKKKEPEAPTSDQGNNQKCPVGTTMINNVNAILSENSEKFAKIVEMDDKSFVSITEKIPSSSMNVFLRYGCEHTSPAFQSEYTKAYENLKMLFGQNTDILLSLISSVIPAAKLRGKPPRIISKKIVRKPMTVLKPEYTPIHEEFFDESNLTHRMSDGAHPDIVKREKIFISKPKLVEKKVLLPVEETVIRRGPVLSRNNAPKIVPIREKYVLDSKGNIIHKYVQKDVS